MTEMVERIARVICCPDGCQCAKEDQPPCNLAVLDAGGFGYEARKVLTALQEPTRIMLEGLLRHRGYDPSANEATLDRLGQLDVATMGAFVAAYRAMIDAALAGAPAARPSPGTGSTER